MKSVLLVVAMLVLLAPAAFAKRGAPAEVKPVVHEGINPFFPALRSGHWLFHRPSPQKQIPSSNLNPVLVFRLRY